MSKWQRNGVVEMPNGPYCRLCGRKLVDESDQWAGRCNNDENCARRVKEQVALSTSIVDEIVVEENIEKLKAEVERLNNELYEHGVELKSERDSWKFMCGEQHAEVERLKSKLHGQECDTAFWKTRCEKAERDLVLIQHKLNPVVAYSTLTVRDGND